MARRAFVCGLAGAALEAAERAFLAAAEPWGIILFARNVVDAVQLRRLVADIREALGDEAAILIDQEGGRVQRIRPPLARRHPPAAAYAALYTREPEEAAWAARLGARLIAHELHGYGIDVDCLPVLDLRVPGAHDIIGDRAYGTTPEAVIRLGHAVCEGLRAGGVLPVVKHIPGHGRAMADSHLDLPRVTASRAELVASDFAPFAALADQPIAMTAHVVYEAIDPERAATVSPVVVGEVIRRAIGFDGLLLTDDLSMQALRGPLGERAAAAFAAGCDVALHCNGRLAEAEEVAAASPLLEGAALRRAAAARAALAVPEPFAPDDAETALARVFGTAPA
jgi:beta-N-acetylhexosaminidase